MATTTGVVSKRWLSIRKKHDCTLRLFNFYFVVIGDRVLALSSRTSVVCLCCFYATFSVRPDGKRRYVSRFSSSSAFVLAAKAFCARRFVFDLDLPLGFGIDRASGNTARSADGDRFFRLRAGFLRFAGFTTAIKLDGITAGGFSSIGFLSSDTMIDDNLWSVLPRHRIGDTRAYSITFTIRVDFVYHRVFWGKKIKIQF